jgi:hypothetical protein
MMGTLATKARGRSWRSNIAAGHATFEDGGYGFEAGLMDRLRLTRSAAQAKGFSNSSCASFSYPSRNSKTAFCSFLTLENPSAAAAALSP